MISKIIIQTCITSIPKYVQDMIKERMSDEWKYYIFNDTQQRSYLLENPSLNYTNIVKKYDQLTGAHKSDLFRYYYLYNNGGIFLDDDAMIYNISLDELIEGCDCFFVKSNYNKFPEIINAFVGVNSNNIIIKEALDDLYKINVNKLAPIKVNKQKYLRVVQALYKFTEKHKNKYNIKFFNEKKNHNLDNPYVDYNDKIIWKHYYHDKIIPKIKKV